MLQRGCLLWAHPAQLRRWGLRLIQELDNHIRNVLPGGPRLEPRLLALLLGRELHRLPEGGLGCIGLADSGPHASE